MVQTRRTAYWLAAGGGLILAALTQLAWFDQVARERGSGAFLGMARQFGPWDAALGVTQAVVAVAALAVLLGLLRAGPWLVAGAGIALVALLVVVAAGTLGTHSMECCPEILTETSPRLPFALAGVAALTIAVAGFWAGESD